MNPIGNRIGELFILGFENDHIDILQRFYEEHGLGGVIVFGRNIESPATLGDIIREIRDHTSDDLIVAIDQEGGDVNRLSGSDIPTFPSPSHFGRKGDLAGAAHAARATSKMLLGLGINMNLSPVADVLTNPDNVLMANRCYSGKPAEVGEFVRTVVGEQTESNIASCAKHFPGLGDAVIDPHKAVALSDQTSDFFRRNMFPPFIAAVDAGCPAIMTTHLKVKSLDPEHVATFSRSVCTGIIREEIGFEGVIMTDDLDMGAVENLDDAVPMAISAGHDMVLVCHSVDKQISCAEFLRKLVESGDIPQSGIEERLARIGRLKMRFKI